MQPETETSAPAAEVEAETMVALPPPPPSEAGRSSAAAASDAAAPTGAANAATTAAKANTTAARKRSFADTYYGMKGQGKYQEDWDRLLLTLLPKRGRSFVLTSMADTGGGEIMRAAASLSAAFYKSKAIAPAADALNFLAMAGVFDKQNDGTLETLHPYAKGTKAYEGKFDGDEVQLAVERAIDRAVEMLMAYPDLEYTENTLEMTKLHEQCDVDFVERSLAMYALSALHATESPTENAPEPAAKPPTPTANAAPLQEIDTPRIANKITFDEVAGKEETV